MLEAFVLGHLSDADSQEIELHLAACAVCCQKLEDVPDDPLVRSLQAPAADTHVDVAGLVADSTASRIQEAGPPRAQKEAATGFTVPRELERHARYYSGMKSAQTVLGAYKPRMPKTEADHV